jgi:hypothetical protein
MSHCYKLGWASELCTTSWLSSCSSSNEVA